MASAYTAFDAAKPAGTQTGPNFATSANANDMALMDAVVAGTAQGWVYAPVVGSGTAEQPQYMVWTNGTLRVRATLTWGSSAGANGNISAATWEVSQDSGSTPNSTGTWASMGTAQTMTYDASGNLTATTNAGSFATFLGYLIGKAKQHAALTGAAAHGLGTISTQAASSVAITGGTIAGTAISTSSASLTNEREAKVALGNVTGSTAIDWAAGGLFTATITNAAGTFTHSNLPSGVVGFVTVDITNGGVGTLLFSGVKWAAGLAPTFTNPGRDIVVLMCHDGSTVSGSVTKDVK